MRNINHTRNRSYAILSVVSPVVAFAIAAIYQAIANSEFWGSLNSPEANGSAAGALMAFAELMQFAIALFIGCIIGAVYAAISIKSNNANYTPGYFSLAFNSVPLALLVLLVLKGFIYGF